MKVFHYVAEELKNEPLFDNQMENSLNFGAVYNDFDSSPITNLLPFDETESFSFSQPQTKEVSFENVSSAVESAVDNAVMEADRTSGLLYEHLQWDSPYFDNASEDCDEDYCRKVFNLATNYEGAWSSITLSEQAIMMFERRERTAWASSDTVYDAWLLRKGCQRSWFDMHLFCSLFPNYEEGMITDDSVHDEEIQRVNHDDSSSISSNESESTPVKAPAVKRMRLSLPRIIETDDEEETSSNEEEVTAENHEKEDSKESIVKFEILKPINQVIVISDSETE